MLLLCDRLLWCYLRLSSGLWYMLMATTHEITVKYETSNEYINIITTTSNQKGIALVDEPSEGYE